MTNLSTRTRLLLVVLLAALPMVALTVYTAVDQRRAAEARAREDLATLVKMAARHQDQIVEGARQTLVAAAAGYPALRADHAYCDAYFREVLKHTGGIYQSIGLDDPDGDPLCTSRPVRRKFNVRDRLYFRLAQRTLQFSIGEFQVSRLTGRPGIGFAYPIMKEGRMAALAFLSLDLARFQKIAASTPLPREGVLVILDHTGTMLARYPEAQGRVGTRIRDPQTLKAVLQPSGHVFEGKGADGTPRLFAATSVARNADGTDAIKIAVSIPMSAIFEDGNRTLGRNLTAIVLATLLLLLASLLGVERLVMRSIQALLDAAQRVRSGDLTARTGLRAGRDELSHIGEAFDDMADALQERDAQLQQALQDVQQQAITDPMTKLLNRRYVSEFLPAELSKAKRRSGPVAVIMLDVDRFKRLNDTHGHGAGDLVLRELAALLRSSIRAGDVAARWGGEEFILLLPESTLKGAADKAELIRKAITELELVYEGKALPRFSASMGVAVFPGNGETMDALVRAADAALYEAKAAGRNKVVLSGK
jgi:diguanylate cyclase (GGDEF)-like protein